jgi:large subunit ribosomal protein L25
VPERIELDVSGMAMGDTLRLGDLPQREGVTYLDDLEIVLATVTMPTQIVEPEPEEEELEEGELPEGEEAPEGAAEEPPAEGEAATREEGEPGTTPG